jgi:aspartate/tyrosine/aromatic aminotransferase
MILTDPELFDSWKKDITTMSGRIIEMRDALFDLLNDKFKTPAPPGRKDWGHIKEQIVSVVMMAKGRSEINRK